MAKHRHDSEIRTCPLYKHIRTLGVKSCYIELLKIILVMMFTNWGQGKGNLREFGTLNKQIAGITLQEWVEHNKEDNKQSHQQYYNDNHDKILKK